MPLRHIAKVKQNALSEATAIAKMRDGWFELVVAGCQGFEPEDVQVIRQKYSFLENILLRHSISQTAIFRFTQKDGLST